MENNITNLPVAKNETGTQSELVPGVYVNLKGNFHQNLRDKSIFGEAMVNSSVIADIKNIPEREEKFFIKGFGQTWKIERVDPMNIVTISTEIQTEITKRILKMNVYKHILRKSATKKVN